ncbi:transmembrane protein 248 isoform X2 [Micropterus dolomieu]|uniref:transmembrane protein 248 isoform X1 n=1 Tax=Micropterus dolomieu TaxID=147949 RepID=UPI001E8E5072|nr:transmembrane protein 248 isoform X1 [Micropterus dolomieu]XP_045891816.1 transmembrane protein 248 isoform X2 [Micropterus dolomieu]XP_045891817.1 transmembrane protein 248 isoform X2 [Micropterus dolomieu]XP_045891818.1 transmembrane protein 248 isoform X2 [Micropterus dolomieu]
MWSQIMGFWQPVTNLRDYVSQNPPGVTFFLCLLTLAVSFICLSSYSYTHTLPNPDIAKDWNRFLLSLSHFQLCVKANESSSELVSPVPVPLIDRDTSVNSIKTPSVTRLRLKVPLAVTTNSNSGSLKDLGLHTALRASQLHLGGNEIVNVTLESGNDTYTCLTISAPTHLLPMSLLPPECPASEKNISPIHVEASNQLPTASQTCYSLQSKNDPTLTVMLTQEEQSVAVQHLLEVSVCLLGVCLILCLSASMKHSLIRRNNWTNGLDLQNEPLIDT